MEDREIFKQKFELPRDGFSNPVDLQDVEIGFCVYKDQENLKRENFKSIFKIYIRNEELKKDKDKKLVIITASYGKKTDNGLISYTSNLNDFKRGKDWPAELISNDEFFYNIKTCDFCYKKQGEEKSINGNKILNLVNEWHVKPTKSMKGFPYRTKIRSHIVFLNFLKILFNIISGIQYLMSGEKVDFYSKVQDTISPPKKPGKKIKIFDYEVEIWIAVIYAIIHLFIAYPIFIFYNCRLRFLVPIFKNIFLTTMYIIISLALTDVILSKLPKNYFTKRALTSIQEKYYEVASKGIKI